MAQQSRPKGALALALLILNWKSSFAFRCPRSTLQLSSISAHQPQPQDRHWFNTIRRGPARTLVQFAASAADISNNGAEDEFLSSILYEGTFQGMDYDGILAYLRDGSKTMPPKTRRLLAQITSEYVYGVEGRPDMDSRGILEVLDSEYETIPSVSVVVGNTTFAAGQEGNYDDHNDDLVVVQVVSLAVLYGLPAEILLKIVDCVVAADNQNSSMTKFRTEFRSAGGWEQVSFPSGLGLRIKKDLVSRTTKKKPAAAAAAAPMVGQQQESFFPPSRLPWRSRSSRKAAEAARRGIELAAQTVAPEQNFMTKEEFLVEIENEIHAAAPLSEVAAAVTKPSGRYGGVGTMALGDVLPSFPSRGQAWKRVKRLTQNPSLPFVNSRVWRKFSSVWDTQYNKLKDAGRAGLLAYAFMNFVLYTVGMSWQWRRIAVLGAAVSDPSGAGPTLVSLTIRKFLTAFTRVYVGAVAFKLLRIVASIAVAPAADRVLRFTQRKLKVSENAAFAILVTLLLKTFFGTLAIVCLSDSALRQAIRATSLTASPVVV